MQTPAGKECRHYHEDFHRGRNIQQCRLTKENPSSASWKPGDCSKCDVPEILNANASKELQLTVTVKSSLMGMIRKVEVEAYCLKHHISIQDAYVGCQQCNAERPGLDIFRQALED
jgi:biotin carboxylase